MMLFRGLDSNDRQRVLVELLITAPMEKCERGQNWQIGSSTVTKYRGKNNIKYIPALSFARYIFYSTPSSTFGSCKVPGRLVCCCCCSRWDPFITLLGEYDKPKEPRAISTHPAGHGNCVARTSSSPKLPSEQQSRCICKTTNTAACTVWFRATYSITSWRTWHKKHKQRCEFCKDYYS